MNILVNKVSWQVSTKQACRNKSVVFFPIMLYFDVLSIVLRKNQNSLPNLIRNRKIQHRYSTKNIPLPSQNDFLHLLIEKNYAVFI